MLSKLQREVEDFVNRGLDRSLNLAVTGLSQSGKTAFITSLVNQLLTLNQTNGAHLPFFAPARRGDIVAVKRVEQENLSIPRFDYEANMASLRQNPPQWCQSTRGISAIRLAIRYRHSKSLLRHVKSESTLYLNILDYPGEWLLDLPLLGLDFKAWSQSLQTIHSGVRLTLGEKWQSAVEQLDLSAKANEDVLATLAGLYTDFLHQCKAQGLHYIQPGHFVLPGELQGAPALQFFPLLTLSEAQWQAYEKSDKHSYFSILKKRYEYYRNTIVKGFYERYFSQFDRQIILADCLTPLNYSQQAFMETKESLRQLFSNFHYGQRSLLSRLFSPQIDKLLFVASKADHITADQIPNLVALMRQLMQEGGQHMNFIGVENDYAAIAAVRATTPVLVEEGGEKMKALQGVRSRDGKPVVVFPGSVPARLPTADFWEKNHFEFDQFEPQALIDGERIPHLRMDSVLQFLLADKLE
ncbi:YcjX family GTP-binding protein [Spirabiliibacterium falconis]|uniref:YcjX family protein n=1 Tax=Spirabiliibacterium falconis TaxID=572023 RepID=UPI001AACF0A8|nr:YcjX family protein [Spirabiliibacterium falconis]MBE2893773.1 GTP-binding protein YcjX [Spirabiliibacterium falconis]